MTADSRFSDGIQTSWCCKSPFVSGSPDSTSLQFQRRRLSATKKSPSWMKDASCWTCSWNNSAVVPTWLSPKNFRFLSSQWTHRISSERWVYSRGYLLKTCWAECNATTVSLETSEISRSTARIPKSQCLLRKPKRCLIFLTGSKFI